MRGLVGLLLLASVGAGAAAGAASGSPLPSGRRSDAPALVPSSAPTAVGSESDRAPVAAPVLAMHRAPPEAAAAPGTSIEAPEREAAPTEPDPADAEPRLVSTGKVTTVYARPTTEARRLGYLRAGAIVARSAEPVTRRGCEGGFYEIAPEGYVCAGSTASSDVEHVMARVASRRADRNSAMPYVYGIAPHAGAPLYKRIPSASEQQEAEPDMAWHSRHPLGSGFETVTLEPIPWFLQDGKPSISTHGHRMGGQLVERRTLPRSGFAFASFFESDGRRFGLTVDMQVIPVDRVTRVDESRFHGLPLSDEVPLPVVFAKSRKAALYSGDPSVRGLKFERFLEFREGVAVTGRTARVGKLVYLETRAGGWIRDEQLVMATARADLPPGVRDDEKWVDVSLLKQTLVAYAGKRPVFVTLVSSGKDGTEDPEKTHSTVQGDFRIHTKHVSVTMDGDEVGDEYELNDVPYVQYFTQGYALHAAYWHDGFGTPRSHGCVNLAPLDARWLFGWTDPPVPTAWHGAMSVARGTLVSIHR